MKRCKKCGKDLSNENLYDYPYPLKEFPLPYCWRCMGIIAK